MHVAANVGRPVSLPSDGPRNLRGMAGEYGGSTRIRTAASVGYEPTALTNYAIDPYCKYFIEVG